MHVNMGRAAPPKEILSRALETEEAIEIRLKFLLTCLITALNKK